MDKTLEDLQNKRTAVTGTFNNLYDTVKTEMYENTIKDLREHITLLENELDKYRELLQDESKNAQFYKKNYTFMKKVKTIVLK